MRNKKRAEMMQYHQRVGHNPMHGGQITLWTSTDLRVVKARRGRPTKLRHSCPLCGYEHIVRKEQNLV